MAKTPPGPGSSSLLLAEDLLEAEAPGGTIFGDDATFEHESLDEQRSQLSHVPAIVGISEAPHELQQPLAALLAASVRESRLGCRSAFDFGGAPSGPDRLHASAIVGISESHELHPPMVPRHMAPCVPPKI